MRFDISTHFKITLEYREKYRRNYTDKCYRANMCAGEGGWRRRLVIYPDNCTYLSVIGRISVRGEGAWRRLQTRTRVQAHQGGANYFLVRMVVPGTQPVENPCYRESTEHFLGITMT